MTDEMVAVAEASKAEAGATNVQFLKGAVENVPLEDATVAFTPAVADGLHSAQIRAVRPC